MKIINGFVTKAALINNEKGEISTFFALSPLALTYARDYEEYASVPYPQQTLYTFTAKNTSTGNAIVLTAEQVNNILMVVDAALTAIGNNISPERSIIAMTLIAQYPTLISEFSYGTLVSDDYRRCPDWVSMKLFDGDDVLEARIWLMNDAFLAQYPDFEIRVVPPILPVNDFFLNYADVKTRIDAITPSQLNDNLMAEIGNYTATCTRLIPFKFYNRANPTQYTVCYWGFVHNGAAGDNLDAMKDALELYLAEHSTHTTVEWEQIFPEIFKRTEFVFYPRWDKIAIENTNPQASLFSSVLQADEVIDYVTQVNPHAQDREYIRPRVTVLPFDYKCIMAAVMPGETNPDNITTLLDVVPDYLPVSTSSPDVGRMSQDTQAWVLKMIQALSIADTMKEFTTVTSPFRRIKRGDKYYVGFAQNNTTFVVAARMNEE